MTRKFNWSVEGGWIFLKAFKCIKIKSCSFLYHTHRRNSCACSIYFCSCIYLLLRHTFTFVVNDSNTYILLWFRCTTTRRLGKESVTCQRKLFMFVVETGSWSYVRITKHLLSSWYTNILDIYKLLSYITIIWTHWILGRYILYVFGLPNIYL